MQGGEEEVISSPSLTKSSSEVPGAVKPDILNQLLDGAKYAVDVDELVGCAGESFQKIENWYEEKSA
jgi:hypothetical protein